MLAKGHDIRLKGVGEREKKHSPGHRNPFVGIKAFFFSFGKSRVGALRGTCASKGV